MSIPTYNPKTSHITRSIKRGSTLTLTRYYGAPVFKNRAHTYRLTPANDRRGDCLYAGLCAGAH
jgi:hypothetical protein